MVDSETTSAPDVIIVGAGIVGICTAALLAEAGRCVVVIDRTGICEETSSGNAAALAFTEILPVASKGVMKKLPRWLMDPLGPFTIRPSYLPKMLPWLYRFWRASGSVAQAGTIEAQIKLMGLAEAEMMALIERAGLRKMLRENGNLELYESEQELEESQPGWDIRAKAGIAYQHVRGEELAALQPGLSRRFEAGTFVPGWTNVSDPMLFGKAIYRYAEQFGVQFMQATVTDISNADGGVRVALADGSSVFGDAVVVAAGAWSRSWAKKFGDDVPLDTERGYNTTFDAGSFVVKRQLTFPGHGFVISALETGVRVGGAVEFAGLKLAPNFARADAMLKKAKKFLPDLTVSKPKQWMGYRPSMPDSLPVIGRSSAHPQVYYAFGHGHLGLTQSASTGRLICDLITGATPTINPAPFMPQRFRD